MNGTVQRTLLHGWHQSHGARMADFGGYEMPLWYTSVKREHLAVLTHAGLFDTGHMTVVMVEGEGGRDLLQYCLTSDLEGCIGPQRKPLYEGRCVYGAFLDETGCVLDDAIVCQLDAERYMVVINAGMGSDIAVHLTRYKGARSVAITDLSGQVGKIDIQGPAAVSILRKVLVAPQQVFEKLPYFAFKGRLQPHDGKAGEVELVDGSTVMLSRTGYTGESGFELFCMPEVLEKLWILILEAGSDKGLLPCGLAARDSLRAGAMLPLSHQDIGPWPFKNHPWPFALPFGPDGKTFTKSFIGAGALLSDPVREYTYAFAGYNLRKVSVDDPAVALDDAGNPVGRVLTCVTDMGIDRYDDRIISVASPGLPADLKIKGLCCGFIKVECPLDIGRRIVLKDNRRQVEVEIVNSIRPDRTARKPLKEFW